MTKIKTADPTEHGMFSTTTETKTEKVVWCRILDMSNWPFLFRLYDVWLVEPLFDDAKKCVATRIYFTDGECVRIEQTSSKVIEQMQQEFDLG